MFPLTAYQLPDGANLGPILRRFLEKEGVQEKQVFTDRLSKGEWSQMMTGSRPLDLNKIYAWLPTKHFVDFCVEIIALKVKDMASDHEREVA